MYSENIINQFYNVQNIGEIPNANLIGYAADPRRGSFVKIWILTERQSIKEITFKTVGCVSTIAAGSVLTQMLKDRNIEEADKITPAHLIKEMGGIPSDKKHSVKLVIDALKNALKKNHT